MFNAEENKRKEQKILGNMKALVERTRGKGSNAATEEAGEEQ